VINNPEIARMGTIVLKYLQFKLQRLGEIMPGYYVPRTE
jgi:hypothetical protein